MSFFFFIAAILIARQTNRPIECAVGYTVFGTLLGIIAGNPIDLGLLGSFLFNLVYCSAYFYLLAVFAEDVLYYLLTLAIGLALWIFLPIMFFNLIG